MAAITKRAPQTTTSSDDPSLASFSSAESAALAALSSAESEFSSVASFLATFTPSPQSVFASGTTSITITLSTPSSTASSTAQPSSTISSTPSQTTASSTASQTTPSTSLSTSIASTSSSISFILSSSTSSSLSLISSSTSSTSSQPSSSASLTSESPSTTTAPSSSTSSATINGAATVSSSSTDPERLSGGQIAGISIGVVAAAVVIILGVALLLRHRKQRASAARESNQIYPEEAYLYDPPITPSPEAGQLRNGPSPAMGGIFVQREFGQGAGPPAAAPQVSRGALAPGTPESFHTASNVNGSGGNTPEREGLIPPVQTTTPIVLPGLDTNFNGNHHNGNNGGDNGQYHAISPIGTTNGNGNSNGSNGYGVGGTPVSPGAPGYVNTPQGTFRVPRARVINNGYGGGSSQATRVGEVDDENDPTYAASPADVRRAERTPLSPDHAGGEGEMGQVRKAWGW